MIKSGAAHRGPRFLFVRRLSIIPWRKRTQKTKTLRGITQSPQAWRKGPAAKWENRAVSLRHHRLAQKKSASGLCVFSNHQFIQPVAPKLFVGQHIYQSAKWDPCDARTA